MPLAAIRARDPLAAACIARTLPLEGGFVDDPADPGGATSHGVSLRFALAQIALDPAQLRWFDIDHDGTVDRRDIAGLTLDEAADIYFADIWLPGWYARLRPEPVAWKAFDVAVNAGPLRAALLLQKALVDVGQPVAQDAVVGPATVAAVALEARRDGGQALLEAIRGAQARFYTRLAQRQPALARFLAGWLKRAAL